MKRSMIGIFIAFVFLLGIEADAAQSAQWLIDKSHSHVGFSVKHLGISKVKGKFTKYSATIKADTQTGKISWLKAKVNAKSVDTGIQKRDTHLQAADFFDAAKYPEILMETKSIKWTGNDFSGKATLTIKGKTVTVPFKGTLEGTAKANFGGKKTFRAGYTVSATIDRQQFGLSFNALAEGVSVVDNKVKIELEIEIFHAI